MSLKDPQQSPSVCSPQLNNLWPGFWRTKCCTISLRCIRHLQYSEVDISTRNIGQPRSARLPKPRAGTEEEFFFFFLKRHLEASCTPGVMLCIIPLPREQIACQQNGWIRHGGSTSLHGGYCKCVLCDLNAGIATETCVSVIHCCKLQYCCSFSWWRFQSSFQRLPAIAKYIQIGRWTAFHRSVTCYWAVGQERSGDCPVTLGACLHVRVEPVLCPPHGAHRNTFHFSNKHGKENAGIWNEFQLGDWLNRSF